MNNTINFELLKKIDENNYINFESLRNNIKCKDKNIRSTFRITAENLLKYTNNINHFVNVENGFYKAIIDNNIFQNFLIYELKCDSKIMRSIRLIREYGNKTTHNFDLDSKIFDENESRDLFASLLFLNQKLLKKYCSIDMNLTKESINNEFDRLLSSYDIKVDKVVEVQDNFKNDIISIDKYLKESYTSITNKEEFCSKENINKFKNLVEIIISKIINDNSNYSDIEDLKIGNYSELYTIYYKFDSYEFYEKEELLSSLKDISYTIKNILDTKYKIDVLDWLLTYDEIDNVNEKDIRVQIYNAIEEISSDYDYTLDDVGVDYYIEKQKLIQIDNNKYYELEIRRAIDFGSKNNKVLVYSKNRITDYYATTLWFKDKTIRYFGQDKKINIIVGNKVSIRPCEIKNMIYIVNKSKVTIARDNFLNTLNSYLTKNNCSILDIVLGNNKVISDFYNVFNNINSNSKKEFFDMFSKSRNIIKNEKSGHNVLRLLLGTMRNTTIKGQITKFKEKKYLLNEDLMITIGSKKFDNNPFSFCPSSAKPIMSDLFRCINYKNYYNSIIVGKIQDYSRENQTVFCPISEFNIENIYIFIEEYNSSIGDDYGKINIREGKYLYIENEYLRITNIKNRIEKLSSIDNDHYYEESLKISKLEIDSKEKKEILSKAFKKSKIMLVYGEAGSGKTELICNHIVSLFKNKRILFVANTYAALNNMRNRVKEKIGEIKEDYAFLTATKLEWLIRNNRLYPNYLVIIDECKVIPNRIMETIINNIGFEYCVLSGDISQIDAIDLGNWFEVVKEFSRNSAFQLSENHRTNKGLLKEVWDKVRNCDEDALDFLINNNYVEELSDKIFKPVDNDEIILCLNYGGKFGINEINTYFQNYNKDNIAYSLNRDKVDTYKKNDPIVFNNDATKMYDGIYYNNLKGIIQDIKENEDYLLFTIKIFDVIEDSIKNIKCLDCNRREKWTRIELRINKYRNKDDDENDDNYTVPFDIAYARSIHKSQGLEYKSVKIIITPESEEVINNEVFYTAVTRATEYLKIYCTKNDQLRDMKILTKKIYRPDIDILKKA